MNDTGYDDRPVEKLSIHDLLEQAEQADFDSGYYAGVLNEGASGSEYEPLLTVARDRRNACFTELKRRLEAAEALATALEAITDDLTRKAFTTVEFGEYRQGAVLGNVKIENAQAALRQHQGGI